MKNLSTKISSFFWTLILVSFISSCSSVNNLAVKWKYRNDFKVSKASLDEQANVNELVETAPMQIAEKAEQANVTKDVTEDVKTYVIPGKETKINKTETQKVSSVVNSETQKSQVYLSPKVVKKIQKTNKVMGNGSGWGVLSFVFGLLALLTSFLGITGVIFGLLGIVFGVIGASGNRSGKGLAIVGIILGALGLVLGGVILAAVASVL